MNTVPTSFTSRMTFEALTVDFGEESDEEQVSEEVEPPPDTVPRVQAKLSKSAHKKAARASRQEKKQVATKLQRTESPHTDSSSSVVPSLQLPHPPTGILANPVKSVSQAKPPTRTPHLPANAPGANFIPPTINSNDSWEAPNSEALPCTIPLVEISTGPALSSAFDEQLREVDRRASLPLTNINNQESEKMEKKRQNVLTRTLWTFIMIGGFVGLLLLGHAYMVLLVILCQTLVYREVTALFSLKSSKPALENTESKGKDPWSKTLNWYFFAVTNYFLYGESIIYYFKHVVFADAQLLPFATNHRIISFTLYTIGFVGFVMSLKKGYLKQQFGLFCWVHMSLLLIVVSSHFIVNNILEGLIWFWVPASLVICNDVFAYLWGITIGRTPLIKLSPNKTVEGFVGAFWSTILFGIIWGTYFMRYDYMICPVHDLGVSAWSLSKCSPNPIFVWREWQIWAPLAMFLSTLLNRPITTIPYAPYHFHLLYMSCFASLVAPFGGFFASGFKRAFKVKDFGDSIPGHGGMTDRMDCQFLMGVFTYVYYSSLIREHHVTVGSILQTVVSGLTVEEQLELIGDLKRYLAGQGISAE